MEISRARKFLLDRGATAFIKLYSTNYCVSPLVQGRLKISCRVEIQMPPTLKNREITDLCKRMIDLSYDSHGKSLWLDRSFRQTKRLRVLLQHVVLQQAKRRKQEKRTLTTSDQTFGLFSMLH